MKTSITVNYNIDVKCLLSIFILILDKYYFILLC